MERVLLVKDEASYNAPGQGYPHAHNGQPTRTPIVIVGNKRDQFNDREVSTEEGRVLAMNLGCEFFETSARLNQNVEAAFKALVRQIKVAKSGPDYAQGGAGHALSPTKSRKHKKCVVL